MGRKGPLVTTDRSMTLVTLFEVTGTGTMQESSYWEVIRSEI
jgi:hypothetical protein